MNYTHVYIEGDTRTPERFWNRTFLTRAEVKSFTSHGGGFVRALTDKDKEILANLNKGR